MPAGKRNAYRRLTPLTLGTHRLMRMSVVDVGSNTVRLMVADVEDGVPLPVHTAKWKLRLSERVGAHVTPVH